MADHKLCHSSSSSTCKPTTTNSFIIIIPSVILHDFTFLCSIIVSNPLYFIYFLFFSPYLFKFISFISPLFLTTSLVTILSLIACTTTFPHSQLGFIQTMLDHYKMCSKINNIDDNDDVYGDYELCEFEEFELYKIVFRDPLLVITDVEDQHVSVKANAVMENTVKEEEEGEKRLENLFEELDRFDDTVKAKETVSHFIDGVGNYDKCDENFDSVELNQSRFGSSSSFGSCESIGDATTSFEMTESETRSYSSNSTELVKESFSGDDMKTVENSFDVESNLRVGVETKDKETRLQKLGVLQKLDQNVAVKEHSFLEKSNSWRQESESSSSFGSYGSMRKEKEWKRTLACKLFEERNNSSGGEEGMDSLWEAYDEDNNSSRKSKSKKEGNITNHKKKLSEFKCFDDEEEDDDEEFMNNGQLCCLKALKLSTGKMNLGMGKPNLVKITKALKGFGWLHHVGSKRGKKY